MQCEVRLCDDPSNTQLVSRGVARDHPAAPSIRVGRMGKCKATIAAALTERMGGGKFAADHSFISDFLSNDFSVTRRGADFLVNATRL